MIKDYMETQSNYATLYFGIKGISRRNVVRIYGFENSFYNSILIQMFNQYFREEHLIPINSFKQFEN